MTAPRELAVYRFFVNCMTASARMYHTVKPQLSSAAACTVIDIVVVCPHNINQTLLSVCAPCTHVYMSCYCCACSTCFKKPQNHGPPDDWKAIIPSTGSLSIDYVSTHPPGTKPPSSTWGLPPLAPSAANSTAGNSSGGGSMPHNNRAASSTGSAAAGSRNGAAGAGGGGGGTSGKGVAAAAAGSSAAGGGAAATVSSALAPSTGSQPGASGQQAAAARASSSGAAGAARQSTTGVAGAGAQAAAEGAARCDAISAQQFEALLRDQVCVCVGGFLLCVSWSAYSKQCCVVYTALHCS